ncbi:MAG: GNAT family N-acetyltransferase [Desulfuromusa sp.]|nr:GNAT family N-acetyltransferase [Desulfuromusa sp.]
MIRPANKVDAEILTAVSFKSKGYWGYAEEYFAIWKDELTISPEYIENNIVFVCEQDGAVTGYYSIIELQESIQVAGAQLDKGFWLEHMFIVPENIGRGTGSELFSHLRKECIDQGINELKILVDPNSTGFYEKMGCKYRSDFPSTIPDRTTPLFVLQV